MRRTAPADNVSRKVARTIDNGIYATCTQSFKVNTSELRAMSLDALRAARVIEADGVRMHVWECRGHTFRLTLTWSPMKREFRWRLMDDDNVLTDFTTPVEAFGAGFARIQWLATHRMLTLSSTADVHG